MNKVIKLLLVSTSLAPILLTYYVVEIWHEWQQALEPWQNIKAIGFSHSGFLLAAFLLVVTCCLILRLARKKTGNHPGKDKRDKNCRQGNHIIYPGLPVTSCKASKQRIQYRYRVVYCPPVFVHRVHFPFLSFQPAHAHAGISFLRGKD